MAYLRTTKQYGNHFGIHTNGILLQTLESVLGFLTELNQMSTDNTDYLSISLDAGSAEGWRKTKGLKDGSGFNEALDGIRTACKIRDNSDKPSHAIRLTYLITPNSDTEEDIKYLVDFAKEVGVDSLRFSVPYDNYNKPFSELQKYHEEVELPRDKIYHERVSPYLSTDKAERPYIFYTDTGFIDYTQFNFTQCIYGYYQITYAADGYAYKCSATAAPDSKQCRLGKITDNLWEFEQMIKQNQNPNWNAQTMCFAKNARCNRMGCELNQQWREHNGIAPIDVIGNLK